MRSELLDGPRFNDLVRYGAGKAAYGLGRAEIEEALRGEPGVSAEDAEHLAAAGIAYARLGARDP